MRCAKKEYNMGKSEKLFSTRLFGYSKDEVVSYDKEQKERQSRLESQIALQAERIRLLEETVKTNETEIAFLRNGLNEAHEQRNAIARVLVDAKVKADEMIKDAIDKGEEETSRLMKRADLVRDHIEGQIERVRDVEDAAQTFARAVIARMRASADLFEKELLGAVDDASVDAEEVLRETSAVLDVDYFAPVRKAAEPEKEEKPEAADKAGSNTDGAEEIEDKDDEDGIPSDYSFQTSDEGQGFFKVVGTGS